jgi:hypothetical protein
MTRSGLAALALVATLAGCTTTQYAMDRWVGTSRAEVIERWGVPDGETELRDDRRVLTWTSTWGFWLLGGTCRQSFTLSRDGVVQEWSYSQCPPLQQPR